MGIENHRPQRRRLHVFGCRNPFDDRLKKFVDSDSCFARALHDLFGIDSKDLLHLFSDFIHSSVHQVNLVDHGNDFKIVFHGQVGVGDRLRFHPLKRIDQQQRPFAAGQRTRNFVLEINVAGRVDQIQFVNQALVQIV